MQHGSEKPKSPRIKPKILWFGPPELRFLAFQKQDVLTLPSASKFGTPKEKTHILGYFLFQYGTPMYSANAISRNFENECFHKVLSKLKLVS